MDTASIRHMRGNDVGRLGALLEGVL